MWAARCKHEADTHDDNAFLTLTYDPGKIPYGGSLLKSDCQNFFKRLRKKLWPKKIRYYMCGEYGEQLQRPHYHVLLFGHDFVDKEEWGKNQNGDKTYISPELEKIWGKGFTQLGQVTYQSAAYVARYVMKKMTGEKSQQHYSRLVESTGELIQLVPEYNAMSQGIGLEWFKKYKKDLYPEDYDLMEGRKIKIAKYFDSKLDELELIEIKKQRTIKAKKRAHDNTWQRLAARKQVKQAQLKQLQRNL